MLRSNVILFTLVACVCAATALSSFKTTQALTAISTERREIATEYVRLVQTHSCNESIYLLIKSHAEERAAAKAVIQRLVVEQERLRNMLYDPPTVTTPKTDKTT